jgi:hypothetical protein
MGVSCPEEILAVRVPAFLVPTFLILHLTALLQRDVSADKQRATPMLRAIWATESDWRFGWLRFFVGSTSWLPARSRKNGWDEHVFRRKILGQANRPRELD